MTTYIPLFLQTSLIYLQAKLLIGKTKLSLLANSLKISCSGLIGFESFRWPSEFRICIWAFWGKRNKIFVNTDTRINDVKMQVVSKAQLIMYLVFSKIKVGK